MIIAEGRVEVRWYRASDFPQLKKLYKECFPTEEWKVADFVRFIEHEDGAQGQRRNIFKVLGVQGKALVLGALMYTLEDGNVCRLRRVAIDKRFRRRHLCTFLISTALTGKRSPLRRKRLVARVSERNYPAQALLSRLKFNFDATAKREKRDDADVYEFTYDKPQPFVTLESV